MISWDGSRRNALWPLPSFNWKELRKNTGPHRPCWDQDSNTDFLKYEAWPQKYGIS